uniref:Ribosomal RNA small subunit methyltransferase G n=1 Tax=Fundidesulfovibrio putealis TaxID=270496 RepID=A0A7C4EKG0_9BACT
MATGNPAPEEVSRASSALGRELTAGQASALSVYLGLLETWNRKTNLVGPRRWPDMLSELVADSWHLADLLGGLALPEDCVTIDFGAGAGIPGVPLRVFWDAGRYVLVEPRAKRAAFLRQCAAMMRLKTTEVYEGRAEEVNENAQVCLSRAFQPWREFLETSRRFLQKSPGGGPGPFVVVFAGGAAPEGGLPKGYQLAVSRRYPRPGGEGYFWVFAPSIASS